MRLINRLQTTEEGKSFFDAIRDKINLLFKLEAIDFKLGESKSRGEGETLSDLRSPVLTSDNEFLNKIRERLVNLKSHTFIDFEEKYDEITKQTTFIITKVNLETFLAESLEKLAQLFPLNMQLKTLRRPGYNLKITYTTSERGECVQDFFHSPPLSVSQASLFKSPEKSAPQEMSFIVELLDDKDKFHAMKQDMNSCFNLDQKLGFQLYFNSSHPEYPIDLRVFLPKDEEITAQVRKKLEGFSLSAQLVFEEKNLDSPDTALIVKAIIPQVFKNYLEKLKQPKNSMADLEEIITLLQELFPENPLVKDLVVLDGRTSAKYPYPHIRTTQFSKTTDEWKRQLQEILDTLGGGVSSRPQGEDVVVRNGEYKQIIPCKDHQLIIDITSVLELKDKLTIRTLPTLEF